MPRFSECWRCGNTVSVGTVCNLCEVAKYCSKECQRNDIFRHKAECIPALIRKTCNACNKSGPNLKVCTGCYQAFYCDSNCQKGDWQRHKIRCKDVKKTITTRAHRILTYFSRSGKIADSSCSSYYYWGNTVAFDCLNLIENEGEDYSSALNILYLGVGDLRNVALTCASLPDLYSNKLLFTLNDNTSCTLARLVLFLYMLIKGDSEVEKRITELWYSMPLSELTYKDLTKTLQELINIRSSDDLKSRTSGLINIEEKHLKELQSVWQRWLNLDVQGTDWILKQRVFVSKIYESVSNYEPTYIESIPKQHQSTAKKWFKEGDFRRTQVEQPAFAENPTLTGYIGVSADSPYSYAVPWDGLPFFGWDYVYVKKFKYSSCIVTMFGDYVEHILRRFRNTLSKQQISFQVVLCDCMDIKQHLETNTLYDRILTSNLMDYIMLPVLLKLCSEMLNRSNTCATIITETLTWAGDFGQPINSSPQEMMKIAKADIQRYPDFQNDNPEPSFQEYVEDSWDFYNYLRALFYAYLINKTTAVQDSKHVKIPIRKELGKEFKLRLRDCLRNENKIVFFRMASNRRTVSSADGDERFLEWTPLNEE